MAQHLLSDAGSNRHRRVKHVKQLTGGSQAALLRKMNQKGLHPSKGFCLGVSCVAVQSMLSDKLAYFDKMTTNTYAASTRKKVLDDEQKEKIANMDTQIQQFLKAILKYQSFCKSESRMKTKLGENISLFSAKIALDKTSNQKQIEDVGSINNQCNFIDLSALLLAYEKLCLGFGYSPHVAFLFTSRKHAVALFYDFENKLWTLVNANWLSRKSSKIIVDNHEDLTFELLRAFYQTKSKSESDALKIRIFSTKHDAHRAKKFMSNWKECIETVNMLHKF